MNQRPIPSLIALTLLAGFLSGCAGLLESDAPPASEWWLEPATTATPVDRGAQALVVNVSVVPGLDTDRILNLGPGSRLNDYAGARWPDHLPEVLGSLLARSFEESGWRAVRLGERAGSEDECLLTLETRAFYGRVNGEAVTERVEVRFDGHLVCDENERGLSTRQNVPVPENRMGAIVAAFQAGLDRSVKELTVDMAP